MMHAEKGNKLEKQLIIIRKRELYTKLHTTHLAQALTIFQIHTHFLYPTHTYNPLTVPLFFKSP